MGSAFWTSLSALCASLLVRVCTLLIEASFKRRVLDYVARADPRLVYQIEQQAFLDNKPGALLRPHPLREVMWQQNNLAKEHLQEMLGQVASAIRELPLALGAQQPLQLSIDAPEPSEATASQALSSEPSLSASPQAVAEPPVELADSAQLQELVGLVREQNELLRALVSLQSSATTGPAPAEAPRATLPLMAVKTPPSEEP
jgi:hypothetical protein